MATVDPIAGEVFTVNGVPLKVMLRKAERNKKIRAFGLILPLLLFLLITFVYPILSMLHRSIQNPEMGYAFPSFSAKILEWNASDFPPPNDLVQTFVREAIEANRTKKIGRAAKRLNYHQSGFRSLTKKTANKLDKAAKKEGLEVVLQDPNLYDRMVKIDKRWKKPESWGILKNASPPTTAWFLLQAVDQDYDAFGNIVPVDEQIAIHVTILWRTIWISAVVTILCLALGFPIAYLLGSIPTRQSNILILLLLLPFWTSLLVRTTAWLVLLQGEGVVNDLAIMAGLWDEPLQLVRNRLGTYIAMVHILLPFMTLPLFAVMKSIDPYHMKAALSLGADPVRSFVKVYLPQTMPGIGAGVLLVFILSLGYYITPALVGGPGDQMLSYFIAFHANSTVNWGLASALACLLMACVLVFFSMYQRTVGIGTIRMG